MNKLRTSFKKFLMGHLSARSKIVHFCLKKNLTSNGSKPIRLLTRNYKHLIPFYPQPRLLAARFLADLKQLFCCPPAALTRKKRVDTKGDQNQLYYRFNPIGVLTQNMRLWQMIAYRQVFNLMEQIFDIGHLLSWKKTAKVNFTSKPIPQ